MAFLISLSSAKISFNSSVCSSVIVVRFNEIS
jgi:hypothetical protein